jgi:hypothetical protein
VHSGWHLQGQNGVTKIRTGLSCKRAQGDLYNFLCKRIQKRHRYDRPTGCKGTGLHARPALPPHENVLQNICFALGSRLSRLSCGSKTKLRQFDGV